MNVICPQIALLGPIGWQELLLIGLFALLIFGRRLPEVARNLGKGVVEFKKGLSGIEDDMNQAGTESKPSSGSAPKIDSPPASQSTDSAQADTQTQAHDESQTQRS